MNWTNSEHNIQSSRLQKRSGVPFFAEIAVQGGILAKIDCVAGWKVIQWIGKLFFGLENKNEIC
jgi:hypothetical protein